jgi:hypothetical protein
MILGFSSSDGSFSSFYSRPALAARSEEKFFNSTNLLSDATIEPMVRQTTDLRQPSSGARVPGNQQTGGLRQQKVSL